MTPQLDPPQPMLIQSKDLTILAKTKVGTPTVNSNTPKENTTRRPNMNSIPTPTINVPLKITLNPIGNAIISHSKQPTISKERLAMINRQIKSITIQHQHTPTQRDLIGSTNIEETRCGSSVPSP